jgi:methanogenic corrinoid protein MtbC1
MSQPPENDSRDARAARVGDMGRAFTDALLVGDERNAELVIRDAMDAKLTTAEIDDEIITPALWLIGELWERGVISVADEHIATEIALRVLALQREAQRVARARSEHRVMLAAPAGEQHIVALRMTSNLLREAGFDVVMLGADVPADALAVTAGRHEPAVICLSATMPGGATGISSAIYAVQRQLPGAGFVIGGRGVPAQLQPRPGLDVCHRVSEVVEAVDALIKRPEQN